MLFTANYLVLLPVAFHMPGCLLKSPGINSPYNLGPMAGLLYKGHAISPAIIPLKPTTLEIYTGDGNSHVLVGQDV
ncbi:hypothetical protein BDV19DRAFT_374678 [Aspergillus venezuelensis]